MQADGPACPHPSLAVKVARLDAGAAPAMEIEATKALYPDRAARMQQEGEAVYACKRTDLTVACTPEQAVPSGYGFEYVGPKLADVVSPADGQTFRVRLQFRVGDTIECFTVEKTKRQLN